MAKKDTPRYVCTNCGAMSAAWSGRCHNCGEWNTLVEQAPPLGEASVQSRGAVLSTSTIASAKAEQFKRLSSGIEDVDTVLGGGLVAGSMNLIAGQPGIGKSTLLLQIASQLGKTDPVLYISGEESAHQVGSRADRLGVRAPHLQLAASTSANDIAATIAQGQFRAVIVDSVQMISVNELSSAAGTVSQITASTHMLTAAAKQSNTAVILVGHVTKEGAIAGPKVMEHLVDVVLQLEGDRYGGFKVLRAIKSAK
jgi:DNA repair protein RadA/Sms